MKITTLDGSVESFTHRNTYTGSCAIALIILTPDGAMFGKTVMTPAAARGLARLLEDKALQAEEGVADSR